MSIRVSGRLSWKNGSAEDGDVKAQKIGPIGGL
jgi:hypothetical protein